MVNKFARLTTSTRQTDRFLTIQAGEKPDAKIVASGDIFALVEINSRWFASSRVGQTLINGFFREYYRGTNSSALVNFELAIRKVNETLAQITQNGETDWIGKLNAILIVADHDEVHFSSTGSAEAHLFRNKTVNQISEEKKRGEAHPLKTFTNIISGNLKANDSLLISNSVLFDYVSLETLRQLIAEYHPSEAALEIAKLLKKEKILNANCLILQFLTKEKAADIPSDDLSETIYLDQPLGNIAGAIKNAYKGYVAPAFAGGKKFLVQSILPATKKGVGNVGAQIGKLARYSYKRLLNQTKKLNKKIKSQENVSAIAKKDFKVNLYAKPKINKFLPMLKKINDFAVKIFLTVKKTIAFLIDKKNRRLSYMIGAIFLIFILTLSLILKHSDKTSEEKLISADQDLKRARELIAEGKMTVIYNEEGQAKKLFAESLGLVKNLISKEQKKEEAQEILSQAQEQLDKLTKTTRFKTIETSLFFPETPLKIFEIEGKIYGATEGGKIYRGFLVEGEGKDSIDLNIGGGKIVSAIMTENEIMVYTGEKRIFKINLKNRQIDELKIEGGNWESAIDFDDYIGNLYLLDAKEGQIWKHSSTEKGFVAGGEYVNKRKVDLTQAVSLTIDGNIYVLKSSGDIVKISAGKQQNFNIKGIPSPNEQIINPARIYTDPDADSIYLLDGGGERANEKMPPRILVFAKDGQFKKQYALPDDVESASDFFVRPKSQKAWILSGNKVYEINLE